MILTKAFPVIGLVFGLAFGPVGASLAQAEASPTQTLSVLDPARVSDLSATLMMDQIFAIMRDEGLVYGRSLSAEMFSDEGGAEWDAVVGRIYDPEVMRQRFDMGLGAALAGAEADVAKIEAFFGSELGQSILKLEVEARRAMLDKDVEQAAKLAWEDLRSADDPRVAKLTQFAQVNDLIESNVMGAMNANLAFYQGLSESGAFAEAMTEDQILADVWSQEPDVRAETEDWLFPFLALAYQPLSDGDLDAYIAFSETPAGKTMNAALFSAFDTVFTKVSLDLGRAAARQIQGQDI